MNIASTGTSSLTALYLQQLLGTAATSPQEVASPQDGAADTLSISAAGFQAQGADPFRTDLSRLQSTLASGDLASAKKAYEAMAEKMKRHGELPADFAAIGKALDAGDLGGATKAMDALQTNLASRKPPTGANPLKEGLDQLGSLIQSGDLAGAKTLFASLLDKAKGLSSESTTAAADLGSALDAGDGAAASSAWEALLARLEAQRSTQARSLESVAATAYATTAVNPS